MTLKGTVSDAMCGAKHPVADAAECTKTCVKKGSDYALIADGGKVYTLKADAPAKAELDKLAGKMAEVSGDVNGMTVMVKSVKMGMIKK
jgi:predicted type IV restriction endonuclease